MEKLITDRKSRLKYYREYNKARRALCKKEGICIICCKRPATTGKTTCDKCRVTNRERMREKRGFYDYI